MPKHKRKINDSEQWVAVKALAAHAQPRIASDRPNRRVLPHLPALDQSQSALLSRLPHDCRFLIWQYVLSTPYTRLERWRPLYNGPSAWARGDVAMDANCFPYRLVSAGSNKPETPTALLLCCRKLYMEALKILYSSTTFVFAMPRDLHCFQVLASPTGLQDLRRIILAYGRVDWHGRGPLHDATRESLREFGDAFHGLGRRASLKEVQVWLSHRDDVAPGEARRPWQEGGSEEAEKRHQELFDVFGSVSVPDFSIHLTWNPKDVLDQQKWPFKVELQTADEMVIAKEGLPRPKKADLND
jgi:hypothetical protein